MRSVALAMLLALTACVSSAPPPIPLKPVRFLVLNDVFTPDTLPDGRGGLARVATIRRRLDDQGPVLFVLAGDFLDSTTAARDQGRAMVNILNRAGLDYATFGERAFQLDPDALTARIGESEFTWLSANCTRPDGTAFPKALPWDTVRVSGHKVGVFGLTLQGIYPGGLRCSNPDTAAHRTIETLASEGAELIVAVTHQPMSADRNLLSREPRLDLILGGHDGSAQDSVVSGRHAVKADSNARSVQFVTLWGGKGSWRQAVGLVRVNAGIPGDTAVAPAIARWRAAAP
ncbi:MAG TPA: metallophosphoesterase [Gemmatimonadales bacterium]|nr:metallophosphoesterase [Gemmatimonadales bacterium]